MHSDVFLDGFVEFDEINNCASAQALSSDVADESLNHVQPRSGGRHEMGREAERTPQPLLQHKMFVGCVVLTNKIQRFFAYRAQSDARIRAIQATVKLLAVGNDLTVQRIEGGEQGSRAMPLVIMRYGGCAGLLQRQSWLSATKGLDLDLLIETQHLGMLWRGHVQTHDIFVLLDKFWLVRHRAPLHLVWPETESAPTVGTTRLTHTVRTGHAARASMAGLGRLALCGQLLQTRTVNFAPAHRATKRVRFPPSMRRLNAHASEPRGPATDSTLPQCPCPTFLRLSATQPVRVARAVRWYRLSAFASPARQALPTSTEFPLQHAFVSNSSSRELKDNLLYKFHQE